MIKNLISILQLKNSNIYKYYLPRFLIQTYPRIFHNNSHYTWRILVYYLINKGWEIDSSSSELFDKLLYKESEIHVLIPKSEDAYDKQSRIIDLLKILKIVEGRDVQDICSSILSQNYDLLKLKFKSDEIKTGKIPLIHFDEISSNISNIIKYNLNIISII